MKIFSLLEIPVNNKSGNLKQLGFLEITPDGCIISNNECGTSEKVQGARRIKPYLNEEERVQKSEKGMLEKYWWEKKMQNHYFEFSFSFLFKII